MLLLEISTNLFVVNNHLLDIVLSIVEVNGNRNKTVLFSILLKTIAVNLGTPSSTFTVKLLGGALGLTEQNKDVAVLASLRWGSRTHIRDKSVTLFNFQARGNVSSGIFGRGRLETEPSDQVMEVFRERLVCAGGSIRVSHDESKSRLRIGRLWSPSRQNGWGGSTLSIEGDVEVWKLLSFGGLESVSKSNLKIITVGNGDQSSKKLLDFIDNWTLVMMTYPEGVNSSRTIQKLASKLHKAQLTTILTIWKDFMLSEGVLDSGFNGDERHFLSNWEGFTWEIV